MNIHELIKAHNTSSSYYKSSDILDIVIKREAHDDLYLKPTARRIKTMSKYLKKIMNKDVVSVITGYVQDDITELDDFIEDCIVISPKSSLENYIQHAILHRSCEKHISHVEFMFIHKDDIDDDKCYGYAGCRGLQAMHSRLCILTNYNIVLESRISMPSEKYDNKPILPLNVINKMSLSDIRRSVNGCLHRRYNNPEQESEHLRTLCEYVETLKNQILAFNPKNTHNNLFATLHEYHESFYQA